MSVLKNSSDYLYNHISKSFARSTVDNRHSYNVDNGRAVANNIAEPWRFPVIDCYRDPADSRSHLFNEVTFVFYSKEPNSIMNVRVIGTFHNLHEPLDLVRLDESNYYTLTYKVPKGEVHSYLFLVNGLRQTDPVNPQVQQHNDGSSWSRFFTHNCSVPLSFERWEWVLLERLTDHILPFRTLDGRRFMNDYYNSPKGVTSAHLLDNSVGVVNFIDKVVAREENHRLSDYKVCLEIIDQVLRKRNPFQDLASMPMEMFIELYREMGRGNVTGWDYNRYSNPGFFLQILRRHTLSGAFSHPKYGGNAACAAWAFLSERYKDDTGTLFNWQLSLEKPLGLSEDYYG